MSLPTITRTGSSHRIGTSYLNVAPAEPTGDRAQGDQGRTEQTASPRRRGGLLGLLLARR